MFSIMKNILRILFQRKNFIFVTFVLPLILVFSFSSLVNNVNSFNIDVYNKDAGKFGKVIEEKLESIDGVKVKKVKSEEEYMSNLVFSECSVVVIIDENFTEDLLNGKENLIKVKSLNENEAKPVISEFLENEASSLAMICNNIDVKEIGIENVIETYNDSKPEYNIISKEDKSLNLLNSLGLVSYIIFVSASMSCGFILEDERLGTKDRVLLSKITELKYYCAQLILYFLLSSVPAIEYFIVCKVLNYNIGFSNEYILLLLLLLLVLLSISFALFISSIIKSKMLFSLIMSAFTVPVFMISGAYWPFEMMNSTLQKIGNALPIRWIYIVIEKLQGGATLLSVAPLIGSLVMLIIVFILLSVFFARNKIVLVNEPK